MGNVVSENNIRNQDLTRLNHALGPVMAGMIIDALDVITFGPIGLIVGLPIGAIAGYWLGQSIGLEKQGRMICSAAAAVYCAIPFTEILPLGTIVGALCRFQDSVDSNPQDSAVITEANPSNEGINGIQNTEAVD